MFYIAVALTAAFPKSAVFNTGAMGEWPRDSVRDVNIVVGCFFDGPAPDLSWFNLKYFVYGEEADLCLRAKDKGYQRMITPEAEIMHLVGASSVKFANKTVMVNKARVTLIQDHWPSWQVPFGQGMMWVWGGLRRVASAGLARVPPLCIPRP